MSRFEKIDVGCELAVRTTSGVITAPTVVLANALGTSQDQWDQVLPRLYTHSVLTYDRPGIGASSPLPTHLADQPRTLGMLADELNRLLDALGIASPRVIAGHSFGALIALMYAARHPENTAGLVLVDCTTREHLISNKWPEYEGDEGNSSSSKLDLLGSVAELDAAQWPRVPAAVLASAPGRWLRLSPADAAEYAPLTPQQLDDAWQLGQRQFAEQLGALLVVADFAGHHVAADQPELVAACISAVLTSAGDHRPVTIPSAQLRYAGGSCPDL